MNRAILVLFCLIYVPNCAIAQPVGAPAYRMGEPILIEFQYDGGIEGWDGRISVGENNQEPHLFVSNGAFLIVSIGSHKYTKPTEGSRGVLYHFQGRDALHGDLVPPVYSRISKGEFNVSLKSPFRTVIDIAEFYEMDATGTYYIYWGMWDLWSQEFSFEVVAHDQKQETTAGYK